MESDSMSSSVSLSWQILSQPELAKSSETDLRQVLSISLRISVGGGGFMIDETLHSGEREL